MHKIVTGRQDGFDQLRQRGGLTGYPNQAESEHDVIENCHASTALSYADGMAKAFALRGEQRHVVAVVGDGALTGGMCWEALNNIAAAEEPAGHRRQRQRPLVRADDRRPGRPPRHAAAQPGLREGARPGQGLAGQDAAGRRPAVRGAARGQEGHQGRGRAAGDVRGPRHQVRRPGRRPRPGRRWRARCAGPRATAGRSSCTPSPARATATSPPRTTRPTACTARRAFDPETGRPTAPASLKWTVGLRRRAGRAGRRAPRHRRHHRRDGRLDRHLQAGREVPGPGLRRRHRRAARHHVGRRPRAGRHAPGRRDLRDVPQPRLRPGAARRRHAPAAGDVRARPRRHHRPGRAQPLRHLGPGRVRRGAGPAHRRARATRPPCGPSCARPSRSRTARRSCGSRPARSRRPAGAAHASAASTCWPRASGATSCWSRSARSPISGVEVAGRLAEQGTA